MRKGDQYFLLNSNNVDTYVLTVRVDCREPYRTIPVKCNFIEQKGLKSKKV